MGLLLGWHRTFLYLLIHCQDDIRIFFLRTLLVHCRDDIKIIPYPINPLLGWYKKWEILYTVPSSGLREYASQNALFHKVWNGAFWLQLLLLFSPLVRLRGSLFYSQILFSELNGVRLFSSPTFSQLLPLPHEVTAFHQTWHRFSLSIELERPQRQTLHQH